MFWYAGLGWERNEFAGFDSRSLVEGGVGNSWIEREELSFRTAYAATYTRQDDIVVTPGVDENWIGYRLSWAYKNLWGANTTYTNDLVFDGNLDESSRWRADMDQGLAVGMSSHLALKLGLRLFYENEPAFESVVLFDESGTNVGATPVQLDELDTTFTASLVVSFD